MGREISASASNALQLSDSVVESQRFAHTGREVLGAEAKLLADDWSSLSGREELLSHSATETFRSLIRPAPCLTGDCIVLFRGQDIPADDPVPPDLARMGPMPLDSTPMEGRYHREAERVLYLSDSEYGVRCELGETKKDKIRFVCRVRVPLACLRIADFCDWPTDHLITAAFSRAEMCKVLDRGPMNYVFSQVIASLISEHFDGMRVPGARGAPGAHYGNVVLFRHLTEWPKWNAETYPLI